MSPYCGYILIAKSCVARIKITYICWDSDRYMGAWRWGGHGNVLSPPRNRKELLSKSDVIFQGSIFSNNFPEIVEKSFFYWVFFQISQQFVVFVQTRQKTRMDLKNFEKYAKIIHFCNFPPTFFEKFLGNFRKFLKIFRTLVFSSKRAKI